MSPAIPQVRLGAEAGRALIGLWFIGFCVAGAQPLYRWLEVHQPTHPEFALLSALGLATLACVGIGLVSMAAFRALMHVITPPKESSLTA